MCLLKWYIECQSNFYNCKFWFTGLLYLSGAIFSCKFNMGISKIYQNSKASEKKLYKMCTEIRKDIVKVLKVRVWYVLDQKC